MTNRVECRHDLFATIVLLVAPVGATVKQPDCAALEQRASTICSKDRWQPQLAATGVRIREFCRAIRCRRHGLEG